jgi:hypothetical protein
VIATIVDSPFDLVTPRIRLAPRPERKLLCRQDLVIGAYQQHVFHSCAFIGRSNGKC